MARDDIYILREVGLESLNLGILTRRLSTNDGTEFSCCTCLVTARWEQGSKSNHTRAILGNNTVNSGSFYAVDDIIACTRYKMAISENLYIALETSQHGFLLVMDSYVYVPYWRTLHITCHTGLPCHRP